MRGFGKLLARGSHRLKRRLDKAPFAPSAADPAAREGDRRVPRKGLPQPVIVGLRSAPVIVYRHKIARRGQLGHLLQNPVGVLVAEKKKGDPGHG